MNQRLHDWLFGPDSDREHRLRVRRFFIAVASYAMWFGFALAAAEAGLLAVSRSGVWLAGGGITLTLIVFYAMIRSGWSRRFRDPALTLAQMLAALAWGLVLIALSREIRGVMVMVYLVVLLFGIFALSHRQFIIAAVTGFLAYNGLIVYELLFKPGLFGTGFYVISSAIIGGVMVWTTLFGGYVSNLRYRLSARNEELEAALDKIRVLADRDELTGLYNRRFIMQALRREKVRADRTGHGFSVCLIDLDHFKQVNDRYGHGAGDRVLQEFARSVESELRQIDLVGTADEERSAFARYGGEEFIIVLPDTDLAGAHACAERIRARQQRRADCDESTPPVTLSAGVAEYVAGEPVDFLLRRADEALYEAKNSGRNRVCQRR